MCLRLVSVVITLALYASLAHPSRAADSATDLRAHLRRSYPSLLYVDRYRRAFPNEVQGDDRLWSAGQESPSPGAASDLVRALVGLQDHHVSLSGAKAGASETLGMLFRTSTDGHMVVWRIFDPTLSNFIVGDEIVAIDGTPVAKWLESAATRTFGGNRRSRMATAALNLGAGTRIVHQTAGVGESVEMNVRRAGAELKLTARYQPMNESLIIAMTQAINRDDLPRTFTQGDYRIGTVRFGAFAPQYDPTFNTAADEASKQPGVTNDQAMVIGFCAVVRRFIDNFNKLSAQSDAIVVDLRGNFGGFAREARLLAAAMNPTAITPTYDVFATATPGVLRLTAQPVDPSCGKVNQRRPIIVFTDAGTRSAGELIAAWLWIAGSPVIGERTIGAGGGLEYGAKGFSDPQSGYSVRVSGNFTMFDPTARLSEGEMPELAWVKLAVQDSFAPSRQRPFTVQAVGMRPDVNSLSTLADLRDGGKAQVLRAVEELRRKKLLQ